MRLAASYEVGASIRGHIERHSHWKSAREYCDSIGKPLLRIGMKRSPLEPPNGDITLDIDPIIVGIEGGVWGDERDMPFEDKEFGVCFNEHTLEHLHKPEDVQAAVNECVRVADKTILLCPSPYTIMGNLFNPTHYLRLWFDPINNKIRVEKNRYRTGVGFNFGNREFPAPPSGKGRQKGIYQAMVVENIHPVITSRKGYFISGEYIEVL